MVQVTQYRNTAFDRRVLYCAWDGLKDEKAFFAGINKLEKAGIPPSHVRAYMLIGFDKTETWDRIWYRFKKMVERDIEPYPMVFHAQGEKPRVDLKCFQRWTNRGLYRCIPWNEYRRQTKSDESVAAWHRLFIPCETNQQPELLETNLKQREGEKRPPSRIPELQLLGMNN